MRLQEFEKRVEEYKIYLDEQEQKIKNLEYEKMVIENNHSQHWNNLVL